MLSRLDTDYSMELAVCLFSLMHHVSNTSEAFPYGNVSKPRIRFGGPSAIFLVDRVASIAPSELPVA
jgi:hypothetical protein|tara:strand:- start:1085 stop:1285 length:201 start_codon:yes stop_codon:yes gene_type:complete